MSTGTATQARGTIIKVPDSSPGLLVTGGQQLPFTLEGRWRSPIAPAANMVVDVDLDDAGAVVAITAVDSQRLAKERLNQFGGVAQQQGKVAADMARQGVGALAARMGRATMAAAIGVWIAWFLLPAISIDFFLIARSMTFWDLLGVSAASLANPAAGSHGLFGLTGLLAIAAPFAAPFVTHPRARLLNAAPLAFLAAAVLKFGWDIQRAVGSAGGSFVREMAQSAMSEILDTISIGAGAYLLVIASVFLAVKAVKTS